MGIGKKTFILLAGLIIVGGGVAAYFLFYGDMSTSTLPESEKIVKRIKIETPPPDTKDDNKMLQPIVQTQVSPKPAKQTVAQPAQEKTEIKNKYEIKTATKEPVLEKKEELRKEKQTPTASRKAFVNKPWAAHIASYVSKEEALAIVKRLRQDKYNAYVTELNLNGKRWYRVRIGFYETDREAKAVGKKISSVYSISGIWTVKPLKKEITSHLN